MAYPLHCRILLLRGEKSWGVGILPAVSTVSFFIGGIFGFWWRRLSQPRTAKEIRWEAAGRTHKCSFAARSL
jgi:hypothetical protein